MNLEMRFPGGKQKTLTFSYDDGVVFDKRLSDIFTILRKLTASPSTATEERRRKRMQLKTKSRLFLSMPRVRSRV